MIAPREQYMTFFEKAAAVYQKETCQRTFSEDLEWHFINGYVFSTPDCFIMGRPVDRKAHRKLIVTPWHVFKTYDTWFIYLASGYLSEFFKFEPFELPYVCWERENQLVFYKRDRVKALCRTK